MSQPQASSANRIPAGTHNQHTTSGTQHDLTWTPRLWGALIVLCGALFLDALDTSMVGVALPSIRDSLNMSTAALQWVVSGYVLGYGGFLLLGGRAADLLGRRRVFLIALGVFVVASLFSGLVDNGTLLIIARFVKGISAAFTAPAGLSIITTTFPEGPARNRALSLYTTCGASGFSLGLVLSGLLTEVGWRWTLLLPAPVALVVLIAGVKLIDRSPRPSAEGRSYDLGGALTGTGSMLLLVLGVVRAPQVGWLSATTLLTLGGAVALAIAFVLIEQRVRQPLLRLGILRSSSLLRAIAGAVTLFGSYVTFQFVVTQYLQNLLGWSAIETALAFLPAGLVVLLGSTKIAALIGRFGTAKMTAAGFVALAAGYLLFLRIGLHGDYFGVIFPSMLLLGIGFALGFPSLNIDATAGVADEEQGLVSGLLNTAFQVGGALVLAIGTAVITANGGNGAQSDAAALHSFRPALVLVTGVAAVGLIVMLVGLLHRRQTSLQDVLVASSDDGGAQAIDTEHSDRVSVG
jgi:MFS family permease